MRITKCVQHRNETSLHEADQGYNPALEALSEVSWGAYSVGPADIPYRLRYLQVNWAGKIVWFTIGNTEDLEVSFLDPKHKNPRERKRIWPRTKVVLFPPPQFWKKTSKRTQIFYGSVIQDLSSDLLIHHKRCFPNLLDLKKNKQGSLSPLNFFSAGVLSGKWKRRLQALQKA